MWTQTHSLITSEVTSDQIFSLFSNVNSWPEWDDDIQYTRFQGNFEKGNTFILKPKEGPAVKIELVEVNKPREFTDLTRFPLAKMFGRHSFEPVPEGLKITTTMSLEGPLAFLWRKIVVQKLADRLPQEMQAQVKKARERSLTVK